MPWYLLLTGVSLCWMLAACGRTAESNQLPAPAAAAPPVVTAYTLDDRPVFACFGDSLTAGFGVAPGQSYPDLLQKEVDERGYRYRVVNAGVSGDTTSSGLARMADVTALSPAVVLLELGANDGLRGLPIESTRANLEEIIVGLKDSGARVLLAQMTLPRNYGSQFIGRFETTYAELAAKHRLPLVPFGLEPLASKPGLLQPDGLHPTAEGYRAAFPGIWKRVEPSLERPHRSSTATP